MNIWLRNIILLACMLAASGLAIALRPTHKIADQGPAINLEAMIPKQFGDWAMDEKLVYQQVSPDVKAALDQIYTLTLTRTYINSHGYRIMLSIPYGTNQSDGFSAHDPEGCYPAQGFTIMSKSKDVLRTAIGELPLRRMEASSPGRHELVTYWFTVGNHAVNDGWERKKRQLLYALKGEIPDGMLVRVSSIDLDTQQANHIQGMFIEELLKALPSESRTRVSGLNS